jgi:hypothetical protein
MRITKYPLDAAIAVVLGLLAVGLSIAVIMGRMGFALFFFWLCAIGAGWMFWAAHRVPKLWPADKREFAEQTAKWLRYAAYLLICLAGVSLLAHFN